MEHMPIDRATRSRKAHGPGVWAVAVLALLAALVQACSDNKDNAGPRFGAPIVGTADPGQLRVQVAVNPNTIQPGRQAGVTVLVTNLSGTPLEGKMVQLSTTIGTLSIVDGFTDAAGKFVSFLRISAADASVATSGTVTAFVEGVTGIATVTSGAPGVLTISPPTAARTQGAVSTGGAGDPGTCAPLNGISVQFSVSGGVPPYTFSVAGSIPGSTVSGSGLYSAPAQGTVNGNFTISDTITVVDSVGATASATITLTCTPAPELPDTNPIN
jgi:hypothetical protein